MAYRQYTRCVDVQNHVGLAPRLIAGLSTATFFGAIAFLLGGGLIPGLALEVVLGLIAYCEWWLYDRLICLGGERCADGMLLTVEPPEKKSGFDALDTDYSINLMLSPHLEGATQSEVENDGIQGELIKEHPVIKGRGFDWSGYQSGQYANRQTAVLHCEFEGAGVYRLYQALQVALPVAAVATVVCFIPVIGPIACLFLGIIVAAIVGTGLVVGLFDKGSPPTNLGQLHTNDLSGSGADILVVQGEWVYDSAHGGWNEIHPIRHCQRIGTWQGPWSSIAYISPNIKWCAAIESARAPLTRENQTKPENQWTIHPLVDGCEPSREALHRVVEN